MAADTIRRADVGAVELAFEAFGAPSDPALVLIMGLATQMVGWPAEFCELLARSGHYVVRFDNRDVGLSTHLHEAPRVNLQAAYAGDTSSAAYTLSDMAADTAGLLDALAIERAHLVGASMGGMIAQTLAIEHPARVASLTSIMSTTGWASVGRPTPAAREVLLQMPPRDREAAVERAVANYRVIGSPGFAFDEQGVRERAAVSYDRAFDPSGVARQLVAILASGDRTAALGAVDVPALVIHGADDPLVGASGGRATAAAIPGAELLEIEGMGHDLPRELWPTFAERIAALVERAAAVR